MFLKRLPFSNACAKPNCAISGSRALILCGPKSNPDLAIRIKRRRKNSTPVLRPVKQPLGPRPESKKLERRKGPYDDRRDVSSVSEGRKKSVISRPRKHEKLCQ